MLLRVHYLLDSCIFNRKSSFIMFSVAQASGANKSYIVYSQHSPVIKIFMYTHIYSVLGKTWPTSAGTDIQKLCIPTVAFLLSATASLFTSPSVNGCPTLNLKTVQQFPVCIQLTTKSSMISIITRENWWHKGRRRLSLRRRRLTVSKGVGKLLNTVNDILKLK